MSKIICDICGTSYPESSEQCPICGSARPADIQGVMTDVDNGEMQSGYTYVKGGRFSKANVKKRNYARQTTDIEEPDYVQPEPEEEEKTNKGLIVTAIVLFAAIIVLAAYICIRFMGANDPAATPPQTLPTEPSIVESTDPEEIPCIGLQISNNGSNSIRFSAENDAYMLSIETTPNNTTDEIFFYSEDEEIATVSEYGKVVAVAPGQTVIVITCGDQTLNCVVICDWEDPTEETTEATESTETLYTAEDLTFKTYLNSGDITIKINEEYRLYNGNIPLEEVTFTSENPEIATIQDGKVLGIKSGITKIYAEYGEFKIECIVRVTNEMYGGLVGSDHVTEG